MVSQHTEHTFYDTKIRRRGDEGGTKRDGDTIATQETGHKKPSGGNRWALWLIFVAVGEDGFYV